MVQRPLPNNRVADPRHPSLHPKRTHNPPHPLGSLPCVKMGSWPASLHFDGLQRLVPSWFRPQNTANVRFLVYGVLLGFSFSLTATSFVLYFRERRQREILSRFTPRPIELRSDEIAQGVAGLIGPLINSGGLILRTDPVPQATPP